MEDPYDRLVHSKVERRETRKLFISLAQLVVGVALTGVGVAYTVLWSGDANVLLPLIGIGLALYLFAGGVFIPVRMRRTLQYLSFHSKPVTGSKGKIARDNALYDDVMTFDGTTPALAALRRKAQIVFLLRMLGIVAILTLLVIVFAVQNAEAERKAIYQNFQTGEVWLTDHNGTWYGIGP